MKGHPTFALMTPAGEVVDWWVGYKDPESWVANHSRALSDPATVDQKFIRLAQAPTAADAATLGRIKAARGQRAESYALYTRAASMDPSGPYQYAIFDQVSALSMREGSGLTVTDVRKAADAAIASPKSTADDKMSVAFAMRRVAEREKDMKILSPYLTPALEASKDAKSGWLADARKDLLVDEALYVKSDKASAAKLKKATMDEGWMTDASALNEYAWWSFENEIDLPEAETLARKGVELSEAGAEKAQVLDTLAEIRNARGAPGEAAELMRKAVTEDPSEAHYKEQLERFEKLAGGKS